MIVWLIQQLASTPQNFLLPQAPPLRPREAIYLRANLGPSSVQTWVWESIVGGSLRNSSFGTLRFPQPTYLAILKSHFPNISVRVEVESKQTKKEKDILEKRIKKSKTK